MVTCTQKRISGPLMDRIDIHMQVPSVEFAKLRHSPGGDISRGRNRVKAARERQRQRLAGANIASNADMHPPQILKYCALDDACQALMKTAMRQVQLTALAYHRVLKLSRTFADLAEAEEITQVHLAEAL
jgi:magnesium chelatase family protein